MLRECGSGARIFDLEAEGISQTCLGPTSGACGKFDDRVSAQTCGEAPGANVAPDLDDPALAIKVDQVNGKSHPEGMYRFTGNDPQPFASAEALSSKETFTAIGTVAGKPDVISELSMPGEIGRRNPGFLCSRARSPEPEKDRSQTEMVHVHCIDLLSNWGFS
jgi:hypothetical protein